MSELSHVDESGGVRMVDVGGKGLSRRRAVARAEVRMAAETARILRELPKGDALATAQLAGIMAAKRTSELIPLCHPLPLSHVEVTLTVGDESVEIVASAETTAQTGVEMEALTAASVAALTVYDMAKAVDKGMRIVEVALLEKTKEPRQLKAAVLTVSDGVVAGTREDRSGDTLEELLRADGYDVERRVVPDERDQIAAAIRELAAGARLVLTTGGTGLAPRDVTPEATRDVLDREAPGIAQALRADSIAKTPHGLLSRGAAGVVGSTLVVNLPGSPGGCRDGYRGVAAGARRTRSSFSPTTRPRTSRRDRRRADAAAGALRAAREDRAHRLRAPVRVRRRVPRGEREAERARARLDHARDGRRPLARDGAQPR